MKKPDATINKPGITSSHTAKSHPQPLSTIISNGNTENLEIFLSKHETLSHETLVKSIFSIIKERKITHTQKQSLQILFRYIILKNVLIKSPFKPISYCKFKR